MSSLNPVIDAISALLCICLPCTCCFPTCSVISGAFFFIRSLLQFVNNEGWAAGTRNGWILTAAFFVDAWLLGE
jgi:hypothetical protein